MDFTGKERKQVTNLRLFGELFFIVAFTEVGGSEVRIAMFMETSSLSFYTSFYTAGTSLAVMCLAYFVFGRKWPRFSVLRHEEK